MRYLKYIFLSIIVVLLNCKRPEEYPDKPEIHFKSFYVSEITDSMGKKLIGQLTFSFIDGLGNIGFDEISSNNNLDSLPDTIKYNLFFTKYNRIDNQFVVDSQNIKLFYTIPYINNIKGDVRVTFDYLFIKYDTIKYEFFLIDRNYNRSNVETTPVLLLKKGFGVTAE
jgi:hypothetical protein